MFKFAVFSGFLGSGKTTTMMALTDRINRRGGAAAMISNDLGGPGLADNRFALLSGCNASELTEECICYQRPNLLARLNELRDTGCELAISDIPGFGIGALDHVYHGLTKDYPGEVALAPFTVLAEPQTVDLLRDGCDPDLRYLLHAQLLEADLIVLNKCDLLDDAQCAADTEFLKAQYPEAKVLRISARTGEGLDALADALTNGSASMRLPDLGYGGAQFKKSMGRMSEYYIQYRAVVCCNDFDGNAYLTALAERVRDGIAAAGCEIPHLKLLAWTPEGDYGKLDLIGAGRPIEQTRLFTQPCVDIAAILNASAACPHKTLDAIVTGAAEDASGAYQLEMTVFKKEHFGMG